MLRDLVRNMRGQEFFSFQSAPSALALLPLVRTVTFPALRTIQANGLGGNR